MATSTLQIPAAVPAPTESPARQRLGVLSAFAAVYTYALIVFGGIVRITGSGMGCGDDWPRCNGEWIPAFTFETLIEYTHRLLAAGIGVVVLAVFAYALLKRNRPGIAGPGGALRPLAVGAVLLLVQVVLGAVTVRLELPTGVTVAHFITAMLFMATLIVAAVRCGAFGADEVAANAGSRKAWRMAAAAAAIGLVVVSFGALTANTLSAPQACRGFPLCNGALLPPEGFAPGHLHWTHRLLAFVLFFHVLGATIVTARADVAPSVRIGAATALTLIALQVAVAAALVILPLPAQLQAIHLALGAAIWFALVAWATLARRQTRPAALP